MSPSSNQNQQPWWAAFRTALIVDDSRWSRLMIQQTIVSFGLQTSFAVDGSDAFQQIESCPPSVVITDIEMPHCSGIGLLDRVRTSPRPDIRDIPFIVVSSLSDAATTAQVHRHRNAYLLSKPLSLRLLHLTLQLEATSISLQMQSRYWN